MYRFTFQSRMKHTHFAPFHQYFNTTVLWYKKDFFFFFLIDLTVLSEHVGSNQMR